MTSNKNKEDLRVLIVEEGGNSGLAEEIRAVSKDPIVIETVFKKEEAVKKLTADPFEVVLLHFTSSIHRKEIEWIKKLHSSHVHLPILVLATVEEDVSVAVHAVHAGAREYLIRGKTEPKEIYRVLHKLVERQRIFSDWKTVVDETFLQATRDALTGLPNRFLLRDRIQMALSEAKRHEEIFGLLFLDLDGFKEINDRLGHRAGDYVLQELSQRCLKILRSEDTIARVGGDEFVVLARHLQQADDAALIAKRIFKFIAMPFEIDRQLLHLSASIGISLFPFDGHETELLLQQADTAMFRAKKSGGNCFEFFGKKAIQSSKGVMESMSKKNTPTILIVEDDADVRLLLHKRLKHAGYNCIACSSVEEAFQVLSSTQPGLVILDLGFRKASGLALLQNLAQHVKDSRETPPVLVVSGYNDPEIVGFTKSLGASGFISKPFNDAQILNAVSSLIH